MEKKELPVAEENKEVKDEAVVEEEKKGFTLEDFSPQAKGEFMILSNIETFLKKVDGLKGDDAFAYVQSRQYIAQKAQGIAEAELRRLNDAKAKLAAVKPVPPTES